MRLPTSVVYLSIDTFQPIRGNAAAGLEGFLAEMERAGVPVVWVSARNRFQLDSPRRALGHNYPFIAESGCGVYIPEGYFNVRAGNSIRLGRFMCVPVAELQPAATDALTELSKETAVETVALTGLSARELARNTGLPAREAEWVRHRDFSELFFFAGAGDDDLARFHSAATQRRVSLRRVDGLWSMACGASIAKCVRVLNHLYERALHSRVGSLAIAPSGEELLSACDRRVALTSADKQEGEWPDNPKTSRTPAQIFLREPQLWPQLANIALRKR